MALYPPTIIPGELHAAPYRLASGPADDKGSNRSLQSAAERFSLREVCETCRDHTRCSNCVFNIESSDNERRS